MEAAKGSGRPAPVRDPDLPVPAGKVGPGKMVLVVGPSGSGKDTLISALKERCMGRDDLVFARRLITRSPDAASEDHDTLTMAEFDHLAASGELALSWRAHGLGYCLPKACDTAIEQGRTVIANGARRILGEANAKYARFQVILVTAPVDVLAARLAARGREGETEIRARLAQADLDVHDVPNVTRIENTGTIEAAVGQIIDALGTV
ncbi:ribose 1,5-bisphosphate phosphokinase PhnN [Roseibium aquae]|uniref:Ribose 1,5-bisphosphate phosphokinase PhnN n=1 Tax=Roseibium aquae TaxID=1323746 RepID=A0A916WYG1_9HYPH|nr:phosphonate metabolism protein/1,5-bisphosphokinase (PRPP-forming) PhnN [Roseibium aquae]GGB39257.1 ribose 1,5-bisphosphate phosphokinase PhnN [Roseibium aquae]